MELPAWCDGTSKMVGGTVRSRTVRIDVLGNHVIVGVDESAVSFGTVEIRYVSLSNRSQ